MMSNSLGHGSLHSRANESLLLTDMSVKGKKKDYPSINDYYRAMAQNGEKPIQYQHGLSNYSNVLLGDDRISFKKSLSQDAYNLDQDRATKLALASISIPCCSSETKVKQRKETYGQANAVVGVNKIHEMEQMMRDKLQQRTKTGPFQLRKTFKYFDRDGSGGIDFSEFQRAMELMGFQFSEIQQLALFARYDESCSGEIDYNDFVEKVMESDFKAVHASVKMNLENMVATAFHGENNSTCGTEDRRVNDEDSDADDAEWDVIMREEIKKLYDLVDGDRSGYIDRSELEVLLKRLGKNVSSEEMDKGFRRLDMDGSGLIDFDEFYVWYKNASYC